MLTVKENLISILETYCPDNVYLQGTLNPEAAYPNTFITFYITDSEFNAFYDDDANRTDWSIAVMIYSNNPDTIDTIAKGVIKDCKVAGFIPQGAGNDIPSDVYTHTGWAIDFIYPQTITE